MSSHGRQLKRVRQDQQGYSNRRVARVNVVYGIPGVAGTPAIAGTPATLPGTAGVLAIAETPTATRISATAGSTAAAENKRVITYTYKQKPATGKDATNSKKCQLQQGQQGCQQVSPAVARMPAATGTLENKLTHKFKKKR